MPPAGLEADGLSPLPVPAKKGAPVLGKGSAKVRRSERALFFVLKLCREREHGRRGRFSAPGVAAALAEARRVPVAAVGDAVVDMLSGNLAALDGAEGPAGAVAEAAVMVISAVGDAVVDVPPGNIAAFHGADGGGAGNGLSAVMAAAAVAVSGDGQGQKGQSQNAEKDVLETH